MENYASSNTFLLIILLFFGVLLTIRPIKGISPSTGNKLLLPLPGEEEFHEELYLQGLSDGFINSHFQFSTRWRYGRKENRKFYELIINFNIYIYIYL